jgi:hypothetical protein
MSDETVRKGPRLPRREILDRLIESHFRFLENRIDTLSRQLETERQGQCSACGAKAKYDR